MYILLQWQTGLLEIGMNANENSVSSCADGLSKVPVYFIGARLNELASVLDALRLFQKNPSIFV